MRFVLACVLAVLLLAPAYSAEGAAEPGPNDIVEPDHWAYDALAYLISLGALNGHSIEQEFFYKGIGPVKLTRQQFADIVSWRLGNMGFNYSAGLPQSVRRCSHINALLNDLQREFLPPEDYQPLTVEKTPVSRFDAFCEVPVTYWIYGALDHFVDLGLLEGYPEGFFKGEHVLTAYELTQATARLLDTVPGQGCTATEQHLLNALKQELPMDIVRVSTSDYCERHVCLY